MASASECMCCGDRKGALAKMINIITYIHIIIVVVSISTC